MKAQIVVLPLLLSLSGPADSGELTPKYDASPTPKTATEWNLDPGYWDRLLSAGSGQAGLPTGARDLRAISFAEITFDLSSTSETTLTQAEVERIFRQAQPKDIPLGKSGFSLGGPIIEGLLPRRLPEGASLGQKLLNLPVVRLFVPQPMPSPPGGGKYFLWREHARSWPSLAKPAAAPGALDNGM